VGLLHHEYVGDVAEVVRSLVQVLGLRDDGQSALDYLLGAGVAGMQEQFVLGE
jgi:hypothetical protein